MAVPRGASSPRWVPWGLGGVLVALVVGGVALVNEHRRSDAAWGDLPTWVGSLGATVALGLGVFQYARDRAWRRVEFLAGEMRALFEAPTVRTATLVLDYSAIRLDRDGQPTSDEACEVVTRELLVRALRDHTAEGGGSSAREEGEGGPKFTPAELVVRRSFDDWFTRLERVQVWLAQGVVRVGDLEPYLGYFLQRMFVPGKKFLRRDAQQGIRRYLARYDLRRVRRLAAAFRREYGPALAPTRGSPADARSPGGGGR